MSWHQYTHTLSLKNKMHLFKIQINKLQPVTKIARVFGIALLFVVTLQSAYPLLAAPLPLDPTFQSGGKFVRNVFTTPGTDSINKVIEQSDGKLVVVGGCDTELFYVGCIARYLPDGTLDPSFGKNGVVRTAIGISNTTFTAVALDGLKIVVAASCKQGVPNIVDAYCFARYESNGVLDTSFNSGGTLALQVGAGGYPRSLLISDGKYIAIGACSNAGTTDFCHVRLNSNGSADATFGNAGIVFHAVGTGSDIAESVAIHGDGLLVAGYCEGDTQWDFCVTRYLANGQIDFGFGQSGVASIRFGSINDFGTSVVVFGTKIYVGGVCYESPDISNFCITSLDVNGALNAAFNGTGKLTTRMLKANSVTKSVLAELAIANGKLYAGGHCAYIETAYCAARYDLNGNLDGSFGIGGIAISDTGPGEFYGAAPTGEAGYAQSMLVSNGRVALAGYCTGPASSSTDFCIYRMTSSGASDTTFGLNGRAVSNFGFSSTTEKLLASAIQPDGKIVVTNRCFGFCVSRLNADGSTDATFGNDGTIRLPSRGYSNDATAIAFQGSKIVIAGRCGDEYCATRLNANGSVDKSFGGAGTGSINIVVFSNPLYYPGVQSVLALDSNILLIGGCMNFPGFVGTCVVRLTNEGLLDTSFATNGIARASTGLHGGQYGADPTPGLFSTFVDSVSIVVAGRCGSGNLCAARFRADGMLDSSFGDAGLAKITKAASLASTGARQKDGKILVAGACSNGTDDDFCVGRFNADGGVDTTFGTAGIVQTAIGSGNDRASRVLVSDRSIILTGTCDNGGTTDFCIAVYKFDGSPALDILDGGKQIIPLGSANDDAFTAHLVNRQLLLLGTCDGIKDADLCAARLQLPSSLFAPTPNDFTADGTSDLLVQSASGTITEWQMNGTIISSASNLLVNQPDWTITHVADFNGDGKADILWRNVSGAVTLWLMDGSSVIGSVGLIGPDANWRVTDVADFNGDGKADILWRNTNGAVTLWLMNGATVNSTAGLLGPDANWRVSHVGDFNGDGKADLLWRNTSGAVTMWLMNGTTITSSAGILGADANWSVTHVADLNGDGKTDLLWRNTNGAVTSWLMDGTAIASSAGILGPDANWRVTHTADFNGDGKADLLWRNTNGAVTMWLMNGNAVASTGGLIGPDANWRVTHTADYSGDGKSDLLWRNVDGSLTVWTMNGISTAVTGGIIGSTTIRVVP
jgi:uncharacterized delta-60 repeat protein